MADAGAASGPPSSGGGGGGAGRTGGTPGGGGGQSRNRNRNRNRNRSGGGGGGNRGQGQGQGQAQGTRANSGGSGGGSGNRSQSQRSNGGGQRTNGGGGQRSGGGSSSRSRNTRSSAPRAVALAPEVLAPVVVEPGPGSSSIHSSEVAANKRRAIGLTGRIAAPPAIVVGLVLGLVLSPVFGAVGLVAVAAAVAFWVWSTAPGVALRSVGAVPLREHDNPRLFNVTEGLCATFGLRMPDFYIVWDAVPNACALGRDPASADLVVTSGLLELLGPIELEGVIAHELAHVKRGDNGVSVIGLALARFGGEPMLRRCVGPNREYRADVVGAAAVRYPRGLLDALRLMETAPPPAGNSVFGPDRFGPTRWVWTDPSVGHRDDPLVPGDLNATSVRAAALREW